VKTQLIVAAAGCGVRLGAQGPKALIDLNGRPLLARTLERFRTLGLLNDAIVTVPPERVALFEQALAAALPGVPLKLVHGGAERQISVANALDALQPDTDVVVIHDAARPFVRHESVLASIMAAKEYGAATVAVPAVDTILQADDNDCLESTPDRRHLWACQTPQTFKVDVIRRAHQWAIENQYSGTDDATLVRMMGGTVKLVLGSSLNFKITTQTDLALARMVIAEGLQ